MYLSLFVDALLANPVANPNATVTINSLKNKHLSASAAKYCGILEGLILQFIRV
jgi:hypothetical protein